MKKTKILGLFIFLLITNLLSAQTIGLTKASILKNRGNYTAFKFHNQDAYMFVEPVEDDGTNSFHSFNRISIYYFDENNKVVLVEVYDPYPKIQSWISDFDREMGRSDKSKLEWQNSNERYMLSEVSGCLKITIKPL